MKILLFIAFMIIVALVYCLHEFYLEIIDYKKFTIELNDLIANKNNQLRHIQHEAITSAGRQYFGNASIGFRKIADLAKIKILDTDDQSNI